MTCRILVGDVRARLADLESGSVQCVVTSPPYFGLRDYGTAQWDGGEADCDHVKGAGGNLAMSAASSRGGGQKMAVAQTVPYRADCGKCGAVRIDNQIGLERTLADYLATMVEVFREVKRVLRDDGVLFLNIGDSYAGGGRGGHSEGLNGSPPQGNGNDYPRSMLSGFKPKDLMMVPARLAIALQDDGWYLRSDIIWAKPNPMPESVTDRPTSSHEHIFLLSKSRTYFFDADAVRQVNAPNTEKRYAAGYNASWNRARIASVSDDRSEGFNGTPDMLDAVSGRNIRNVWHIASHAFPEAHFATFPPEIPRRCIKAGTSEKGACAACSAPWVRVTDREFKPLTDRSTEKMAKGSGDKGLDDSNHWGETPRGTVEVSTTGWSPSCDCDAGDPIPCKVLDPFAGSGTTGLVADQLGRDSILIELNASYAEMAHRRIYGAAPLFAEVNIA